MTPLNISTRPLKIPTPFPISLSLRQGRLTCIHLYNHPQGRLLHNRQLICCLCALDLVLLGFQSATIRSLRALE